MKLNIELSDSGQGKRGCWQCSRHLHVKIMESVEMLSTPSSIRIMVWIY